MNLTQIEKKFKNIPYDVNILSQLITAYLANNLQEKARNKLLIFIDKYGGSKETSILKAKIALADKRFISSLNHWEEVLEYNPSDLNVYYQIINLNLKLEMMEDALTNCQNMQRCDKHHYLTKISYARYLFHKKLYNDAIVLFQDIFVNHSKYKDKMYVWIIKSYYKLSNIEETEKYIELANKELIPPEIKNKIDTIELQVQKYKRNKLILNKLDTGKELFREKLYDKAILMLKDILSQDSKYRDNAYILIIKSYYKLSNIEETEKYIELANKEVARPNIQEQIAAMEERVHEYKNKVLLIGTCRIKRMRSFIKDDQIKRRIASVSSHVHYLNEIEQMVAYIKGDKIIPEYLLPLVIDDINAAKLKSFQEVEQWRRDTNKLLKYTKKVIIEISSIKNFKLTRDIPIYGNLTSIKNVIKSKSRFTDFTDVSKIQEEYQNIEPFYSNEDDIRIKMIKVKAYFPNIDILWVSHFRYGLEPPANEIEERKLLQQWVETTAKELGDDYLDQSIVLKYLSQEKATIDSSHYSKEAEILMAKIISHWVQYNKLPTQYNT